MRAALPFLLALVGLFASLTGPAQAAGQQTEPTRPSFAEFLAAVRSDAIARGVRETVVDEALSTVSEPLPVVIERDRTQAETVLALEKYLARRLTPKTIRTGREMLARHHDLLAKV